MGWDIQINPTAEAFPITYNLVELLDEYATDFALKYCYIQRDPELIGSLQAYRPADDRERLLSSNSFAGLNRSGTKKTTGLNSSLAISSARQDARH